MEGVTGSNLSMLAFLEFAFSLLPFQVKKFGLRKPGYPQIPKRFSEIEPPPSRKINCFLTGAVAVDDRLLTVAVSAQDSSVNWHASLTY